MLSVVSDVPLLANDIIGVEGSRMPRLRHACGIVAGPVGRRLSLRCFIVCALTTKAASCQQTPPILHTNLSIVGYLLTSCSRTAPTQLGRASHTATAFVRVRASGFPPVCVC